MIRLDSAAAVLIGKNRRIVAPTQAQMPPTMIFGQYRAIRSALRHSSSCILIPACNGCSATYHV